MDEKSLRNNGITMYVTLEPCSMCVGAMIRARVAKVVYGAAVSRPGPCRTTYRA
ncbi:MAG: deaminase [Gammaproteobacteria bacterium]|nr:deaminase [Gammaproteobacteria bacterium]MDX2459233.1 deaminase [Gammaproteobacteria bacterium]